MKFKSNQLKRTIASLAVAAMVAAAPASSFALDMADYLVQQQGYKMSEETLQVESSKVFNIVFTEDIDEGSLGGVDIYEKDGSQPLDRDIKAVDSDHVTVTPMGGLETGKSYYLIVHSPKVDPDSIRSAQGESLDNGAIYEFEVKGEGEIVKDYISNVKASGSIATAVTGSVKTADRVEVEYKGMVKEARLEDGEFSWNIFPALSSGTQVTIRAYRGAELLQEMSVASE